MLLSTKMSYFPTPYLHGENSIEEEKDRDSCFINPFFIDFPKVSDPIFVPSISEHKLSSIKPAPKNQMTGKVYSRKKVAIPRLIQVQ